MAHARANCRRRLAFHHELRALLAAAASGELSPSTALDLLRAGRGDVLRGQPESVWLEAKAVPYDLDDENVRFELGKDVAAMANSRRGGIIVLGLSNERKTRRGEVDTIGGYSEIDLSRVTRQRYRHLVAHLVYPTLIGFDVELIEGSAKDRGVAVLVIPPQPETKRPFLVQGTIDNGRVLGNHVLLPWRREDETDAMDAVALHARIRLGEQAIAGGDVPPLS
jgi:ABC-type amino acid transport substrate-binding protein